MLAESAESMIKWGLLLILSHSYTFSNEELNDSYLKILKN